MAIANEIRASVTLICPRNSRTGMVIIDGKGVYSKTFCAHIGKSESGIIAPDRNETIICDMECTPNIACVRNASCPNKNCIASSNSIASKHAGMNRRILYHTIPVSPNPNTAISVPAKIMGAPSISILVAHSPSRVDPSCAR